MIYVLLLNNDNGNVPLLILSRETQQNIIEIKMYEFTIIFI